MYYKITISFIRLAEFLFLDLSNLFQGVGFNLTKYPSLWSWYNRTKKAMTDFDYEELNQFGANAIAEMWKSKVN